MIPGQQQQYNPYNYVGPPQPWNNQPQQPGMQQSMGGQQQGAVAAATVPPNYQPQFDPANDPAYARGHQNYPHPGEHFFTTKQLITRYASIFVAGVIGGGALMFYMFPIIVRVVTAAAGGV